MTTENVFYLSQDMQKKKQMEETSYLFRWVMDVDEELLLFYGVPAVPPHFRSILYFTWLYTTIDGA